MKIKIGIRSKFASFTIILVIVFAVMTMFMMYQHEKKRIIADMGQKQDILLKNFSAVCSEALSTSGGDTILISYVKILKNLRNGDILYLYFLDTSRKRPFIRIHSDPRFIYVELDQWLKKRSQTSGVIERQETVFIPGKTETVGEAVVGFNKELYDRILKDQLDSVIRNTIRIAVAIGMIAFLVSLLVALTITKSIRKLVDGVKIIGSGNFKYKVSVSSHDETMILAQEFNRMADHLAELDQMKDDFVSSVSHELRSPLIAIKGYVNYILKGKSGALTSAQKEQLEVVMKNAQRLHNFINNILDIAKIEAGQMEYEMETVSFETIAQDILSLFKGQAQEKKVVLNCSIARDMNKVLIDVGKIHQVVTNIVSNALKFTPEGGVVTIHAVNDGGDWVRVSISDTGTGIPEDQLKKIFEKFKQAKNDFIKKEDQILHNKNKGTGLGLTIAKGIVEAHKGRMWVENNEDKGTTFHFAIPAACSAKTENILIFNHAA